MDQYVSAMGEGRTRQLVRALGWGLMITPLDPRDPGDLPFVLDNGEYAVWQAWIEAQKRAGLTEDEAMGKWIAGGWAEPERDEDAFEVFLERYGPRARWVVAPDIVAAGQASLDRSTRWMNRCRAHCDMVLIAVQNGMTPADLAPYVSRQVGIFLGGSTDWKKDEMRTWGEFCAEKRCHYHIARVNTERRYQIARWAGAHSTDGTSGTKFTKNMEKIDTWRRQQTLFKPGWDDAA